MKRLLVVAALAACGQDQIGVADKPSGADYGHTALTKAVDAFVAAKRTPEAYKAFAATVTSLQPGMDRAVAEDAERDLVVLALDPVKAVADKPVDQQVLALGVTVLPTLLAPPVEAEALLQVKNAKAPQLVPRANEDSAAYIERLCGIVLAADCKHAVPEMQGPLVMALAIRRATERVRNAVGDCLSCSSEPGWKAAVGEWEKLDSAAAATTPALERMSDHENWPVAGAASEEDPGLPEAELNGHGELVVKDHTYGPNQQRIDVLKELRGTSDVIALHVEPDTSLAEMRGILVDARKAGCSRVAVIAREGVYPWRRRVYWVADGSGMRPNLRGTDTLQLLLHAIDEVAGPGTVARVD